MGPIWSVIVNMGQQIEIERIHKTKVMRTVIQINKMNTLFTMYLL